MGGCSSKPKTAEFEGSMDLQEGKPQDEAPRQSSEAEKIGVNMNTGLKCIDKEQESSERAMQTLLPEKDDLRELLAETEKHLITGFNPEDDLKEEKHIIEGDPKHGRQILEEISNNLGVEKELSVTGETLELPKDPKVLASEKSELCRDSVLMKEGTKELQGTPLLSVIEAQAKSVDDAARTSAEIFTKSQAAAPRLTDDFLSKESSGEMLGITLVEGDYIWGKTNVDSKYISSLGVVSEERIHMELPETSVAEVQGEKLNTAFTCNGQLKSDVSSISDQATAPQVTANAEKPEAQFVHLKEPTEPTLRKDTLAQEISAPDIDEVWEKLASEFERQESLARAIP